MRKQRFLEPFDLDLKKPGSKIGKNTRAIAFGNKREKADAKLSVFYHDL